MLPEKPWPPEAVLRLLAMLFVSVTVGMLAMSAFSLEKGETHLSSKALNLVVGTLSFHGAALFFIWSLLRRCKISWSEAFGFAGPGLIKNLSLAALTSLAVLPVAWLLGQLSMWVMQHLNWEPVAQPTVLALKSAESDWLRMYFGIVAVVVAPVAEELLFRGILYPSIKQRGHPRLALWGTALLFAATHANAMTFVPLCVLAIVLTLLYEITGNLLAPILTHGLFNAMNFIWLVNGG